MKTATKRSTAVALTVLTVAVLGTAYGVGRAGLLSSARFQNGQTVASGVASKYPPIKFGDQLSPAAIRAISSVAGSGWRRAIVLVVARRIEDSHAQAAYLNVLREHYQRDGLTALCLAPAALAAASQDLCHSLGSGNGNDWGELASGRENLLVVNADGRVEFTAPGTPPADTIRQVAERFARGHIDYEAVDPSGLPAFIAGSAVPDITLTRAGPADVVRLRSIARPGSTIIYFGAACSACSIRGYGPSLAKFVKGGPVKDLVLIFATPADDPMVRDTLESAGLRGFPVFEVHSVSTAYATRFASWRAESGPLVVAVGNGARVESVSPAEAGGES
jgi:hypothetical protein